MKPAVLLSIVLVTAVAGAQDNRKFIKPETGIATQKHLPFSSAVLVDHTLYVSGVIARSEDLTKGISAEEEKREAMDKLQGILKHSGFTMADVVSVQIFCTDMGFYDDFNRVYSSYFHDEKYPARAFIGVSKLNFGAHLELMATAVAKH